MRTRSLLVCVALTSSSATHAQFNISLPNIQLGPAPGASSTSAADPGEPIDKQCRAHLRRVDIALQAFKSYRTQEHLTEVKSHFAAAERCTKDPLLNVSPNKAAVLEAFTATAAQVREAERTLAFITENKAITAEGEALLGSLETTPDLDKKLTAWRERAAAAKTKGNPYIDVEWLEKKIADQRAWLSRKQAQAQLDAQRTRLLAGGVLARLPDVKAADLYDLQRLAKVFEQMNAADLVVTTEEVRLDTNDGTYEPVESFTKQRYASTNEKVVRGGFVTLSRYNEGPAVQQFDVEPAPLPAGTAGFVVQEFGTSHVIFVSLDGGRYQLPLRSLQLATGPVKVPTTLVHDGLSHAAITTLAGRGSLDAALLADVDKAQAAAVTCTERVWKSTDAESAAIDRANITASTRENRQTALADRTWKLASKNCAGAVATFKKAWLKAVDVRAKQREALLKVAQARFAAPH